MLSRRLISHTLVLVLLPISLLGLGCDDDPDGSSETGGPTGSGGSDTDSSGGSESGGGGSAVDYDDDIQPLWEDSCIGCHGEGQLFQLTLDLSAAQSKAALVGPTATQAMMPLVTPGDLTKSYLWLKLNGTHLDAGGSGSAMPSPPGKKMDSDQLALIETWITEGAN